MSTAPLTDAPVAILAKDLAKTFHDPQRGGRLSRDRGPVALVAIGGRVTAGIQWEIDLLIAVVILAIEAVRASPAKNFTVVIG